MSYQQEQKIRALAARLNYLEAEQVKAKLRSKRYKRTHLQAKLIMCVVLDLFMTITIILGIPWLNLLIVWIWVLGVNTIGHGIEEVRHEEHLHDII